MERPFGLITFNSRNHVPGARAELTMAGIDSAVMPTPRSLSAACGLSLRVAPGELSKAARLLLKSEGEGLIGLYQAEISEGRPLYHEVEIKCL